MAVKCSFIDFKTYYFKFVYWVGGAAVLSTGSRCLQSPEKGVQSTELEFQVGVSCLMYVLGTEVLWKNRGSFQQLAISRPLWILFSMEAV